MWDDVYVFLILVLIAVAIYYSAKLLWTLATLTAFM